MIYLGRDFLILLLLQIGDCFALWWSMGKPVQLDLKHVCRRARKYRTQSNLCQSEPDVVQHIIKGADLGIQECQYQLRFHRWNCTTNRRSLGKILQRESAFVQAITAAGVAHQITTACTLGQLSGRCACQREYYFHETLQKWHWSGCGDNVAFGQEKSQEFMDLDYGNTFDIRTRIMHHNNQVGRVALKNSLERKCKCHGMSGSCEMKTCIHRLPKFSRTGQILINKFDQAKAVFASNDGHNFLWSPKVSIADNTGVRLKMSVTRRSVSPDEALIFTDQSPNFCQRNRKFGVLGPKGRYCNPSIKDSEHGSCAHLCCSNRNYKNVTRLISENCNCKFKWCCEVVCHKCTKEVSFSQCVKNV